MLLWASGWYEAERHNQKPGTIDTRMDDDADRCIPRKAKRKNGRVIANAVWTIRDLESGKLPQESLRAKLKESR